MATIAKNTVFTNVGETSDGGVWWEGLDAPPAGVTLTDWHGKAWKPGGCSLDLILKRRHRPQFEQIVMSFCLKLRSIQRWEKIKYILYLSKSID